MKIYKVKVGGKIYEVELESVTENSEKIVADAPKAEAPKAEAPKVEEAPKVQTNGEGEALKAPMQGTILSINVKVGDAVKRGQTCVVLEAMKLENDIVAPVDGVVKEILVSKGQSVNNQETILIIG